MSRLQKSPVSRPRRSTRSGFPARLRDELTHSEFGRCDTCGAPCDCDGCTADRSHEIANDKPYIADDLVRDTLADLEEKAPRRKGVKHG